MLKRSFDLILSLILILLFSPILFVLTILVYWQLGYPILFKQSRPGINKKIFNIYKFRTMTDEYDDKGVLLPDSNRLTAFGKFLRLSSLDELPALWNVLKGDMSLVGPRPLLIQYLPYYTEEENKRFLVRPGITGLAQISGRNYLPWDDRLKLDIKYVENQSFLLDMRILILTFWKVIMKKDIATDTDTVETFLDQERTNIKTKGYS